MNSNLFHNIANVVSLLLAASTAALVASGCVTLATGALSCTSSWINPAYTTGAIAAIQAAKMVVNIVRDGVSGLTAPQPPVQK